MWKKTNTSELKKGDKVRIADDESIKEGIVERTAAARFIYLSSNSHEGIGAYEVERLEKSKSKENEELFTNAFHRGKRLATLHLWF